MSDDRKRTEGGSFEKETTPSDVIAAIKAFPDSRVSTAEVAEACDCSPETARRRLHALADKGRVRHQKAGSALLWTIV